MQQKKDILLESKYPSEIEFTSVGALKARQPKLPT